MDPRWPGLARVLERYKELLASIPFAKMRPSRRFLWVLGFIVVLGSATDAWHFYLVARAERRLQRAIAEADRLDPDWRFDDLKKSQPILPDDQNGAVQRWAVRRLFPAGWSSGKMEMDLDKVSPEVQLDAALTARLRQELAALARAVAAARKLASAQPGTTPVDWGNNTTTLPQVLEALQVARVLGWDAILLAQDHDMPRAMLSWRAILGTARTLGEDPYLMNALVRHAIDIVALTTVKRLLAQGEMSADTLALAQRLMEDEIARPVFRNAWRGERARADLAFAALEAGDVDGSGLVPVGPSGWVYVDRFRLKLAFDSLLPGSLKENHAAALEFYTHMIEVVTLPENERINQLDDLTAWQREQPWLVRERNVLPRYQYQAEVDLSKLHAAIVGLATERYRMAYGHWPASLEALVPQYLSRVPAPLFLLRADHRLIIDAASPLASGNNGTTASKPTNPALPGQFCLWDVAYRGQPAAKAAR
jgi:hypothetical protein